MANNKIARNLSGPERWARVAAITESQANTKLNRPGKFKPHDFKTWTTKQKEAYTTAITGIKPNQGTNRDKRAGRDKGRYIKGKV